MFLCQYLAFGILGLTFTSTAAQYGGLFSDYLGGWNHIGPRLKKESKLEQNKVIHEEEKVLVEVYYECLCYGCRVFHIEKLVPAVKKIGQHLDLESHPYGRAKTIYHEDGVIQIICKHGIAECKGLILHACALDFLQQDVPKAIEYNACMMDFDQNDNGSNEEAALKCGKKLNVESEKIISCAQGGKGVELLFMQGLETEKVEFTAVPYILINGKQFLSGNFTQAVCKAFEKPPKECSE